MQLDNDKMRKMFITLLVGFISYILLKTGAKLYGKSQLCQNLLGEQYNFGHFVECRAKVGEMTLQLMKEASTNNLPQSYLDTINQISIINFVVDMVGYLIIAIVLLRCVLIFRKTG